MSLLLTAHPLLATPITGLDKTGVATAKPVLLALTLIIVLSGIVKYLYRIYRNRYVTAVKKQRLTGRKCSWSG